MRLVVTAVPTEAVAERLADGALAERLAACVQLVPVRSRYWWEGRIERAEETLLVFKTVPKRVGGLFRWLTSHHPYQVPEIIELDVPRVHDPYLGYLAATIDKDAPPFPLGGGSVARPALRRRGSRRAPAGRRPARTRAPRRRP